MNDVAIRNYAKTTLAAAEHLIAVYQVSIDHGDFNQVRAASAISFVLATLADNIRGQLTLRPAVDESLSVSQVAKLYPALFSVEGGIITPKRWSS